MVDSTADRHDQTGDPADRPGEDQGDAGRDEDHSEQAHRDPRGALDPVRPPPEARPVPGVVEVEEGGCPGFSPVRLHYLFSIRYNAAAWMSKSSSAMARRYSFVMSSICIGPGSSTQPTTVPSLPTTR